jgi:hypothetical protein
MHRNARVPLMLLLGLSAGWFQPGFSQAADAPKYDSPAAVMAAAEEAYGKGDYKTFAACFDSAGQKQTNAYIIGLLTVYMQLSPSGNGKAAKAMLAKYGVTDVAKHGDESDDQFNARLAGQIKDPEGFMAEATPLATPPQVHIHRAKGALRGVTIDGQTARATYFVKPQDQEMTQDITFAQAGGSWKISCVMDMESNVIAGG